MAREGLPFLAVMAALALACWYAAPHFAVLRYGAVVFGILSAFMVFFFRDPARTPPAVAGAIVSAADGKVMEIAPAEPGQYMAGGGTRVSIFLSVFDVHINRAPMAGRVDFVEWNRGDFRAAYRPDASVVNEHTAIGISNGPVRVVVKQIVGVLARRIACYLSPGDEVAAGQRFGLIRFGSRVDHILPPEVEVQVRVGDRVRGGETVLGIHRQTGV
ncbi:MAG: phosphatidylserine decarboxylase [Gemmatimonadota bacterium]